MSLTWYEVPPTPMVVMSTHFGLLACLAAAEIMFENALVIIGLSPCTCPRQLTTTSAPLTMLLMYILQILLALLLLNMLIAMMAKTFDTIFEQQERNYNYMSGCVVVSVDLNTRDARCAEILAVDVKHAYHTRGEAL